jgi:hypothetical protein
MRHTQSGNVTFLPRTEAARLKQRELSAVPDLASTLAALREIADLSGDNLVMQGPVHRDFRLIGLVAEVLSLARQYNAMQDMRREARSSGAARSDDRRAAYDAMGDSVIAHHRRIITLTRAAAKITATTAAGIYAKALLTTVAPSAAGFATSLATDLISCPGLRESLTWPARGNAS